MATVNNPFGPIHDELWTLFEANTALKALVRVANRIKLDGKPVDPFKSQYADGDYPEIILVPSGGQFEPIFSSDASRLVQWYDIQTNDGDLVASNKFFPLKWQIIKSLAKFADNIRTKAYASETLKYVTRVFAEDIEEGMKPKDEHVGWFGIIRISVLMSFSIDDLTTIP